MGGGDLCYPIGDLIGPEPVGGITWANQPRLDAMALEWPLSCLR